jgi:hypothetical protein
MRDDKGGFVKQSMPDKAAQPIRHELMGGVRLTQIVTIFDLPVDYTQ